MKWFKEQYKENIFVTIKFKTLDGLIEELLNKCNQIQEGC